MVELFHPFVSSFVLSFIRPFIHPRQRTGRGGGGLAAAARLHSKLGQRDFRKIYPPSYNSLMRNMDEYQPSTYIISMGGRPFPSVRSVVRPVVHSSFRHPSFHPSKAKNGKRRRRIGDGSTPAHKAWPT